MDAIKLKIPRRFETEILPRKLLPVRDYIAWVLHKLRDGKTHRLMARHLDNLFPRSRCTWTIAKNWLIDQGYIERPLPYDIGSHAFGFRLARSHRPRKGLPQRGMKLHVITDISLIKKLRRRWAKQSADQYSQHIPVFEAMRDMLGRLHLDGHRLGHYLHARKWGRVFSPLTNLPKSRRRGITLDGQTLVQIDIKNCQPHLLAFLASIPSEQLPSSISRLLNGRGYIDINQLCKGEGEEGAGRSAVVLDDPKIAPDVRKALELCERGRFYESLLPPGRERGELKVDFYRSVLFGPGYPSPASRAFQARFPSLAKSVRHIKRGGHRRLARILQKLESSLMIGRVATSLLEAHPGLWFATLHDALIVRGQDVDIALGVIEHEFAEIGLRPALSVGSFV